jgi:hypothetical protein
MNSSGITVILFGFLISYTCAKYHSNLIFADLIRVVILGSGTNCKTVYFVIFSIPLPFHLNIDSNVPLQSAIDLCFQIKYLLKMALVTGNFGVTVSYPMRPPRSTNRLMAGLMV